MIVLMLVAMWCLYKLPRALYEWLRAWADPAPYVK